MLLRVHCVRLIYVLANNIFQLHLVAKIAQFIVHIAQKESQEVQYVILVRMDMQFKIQHANLLHVLMENT